MNNQIKNGDKQEIYFQEAKIVLLKDFNQINLNIKS
jgi:hypothetical protein